MYRCLCSRKNACYFEMWQENYGVQGREKGETSLQSEGRKRSQAYSRWLVTSERVTSAMQICILYDSKEIKNWNLPPTIFLIQPDCLPSFLWPTNWESFPSFNVSLDRHRDYQSVYLFTQLIANRIRDKIDKDFCSTGGYISAGKGREIIYPDTIKLKTEFDIRLFEVEKRKTENPRRIRTAGQVCSVTWVRVASNHWESINSPDTEEDGFYLGLLHGRDMLSYLGDPAHLQGGYKTLSTGCPQEDRPIHLAVSHQHL